MSPRIFRSEPTPSRARPGTFLNSKRFGRTEVPGQARDGGHGRVAECRAGCGGGGGVRNSLAAATVGFCVWSVAAFAQGDLDWSAGVGMTPCKELSSISDAELIPWVQGYWTGANLYLGGADLCSKRASIVGIDTATVRTLIEVQCAPIQESEIMFAVFNALKNLPKLEGSRAAACGGTP